MSVESVISGAARWHVEQGDALDVLRSLPDACIDAVVTDPPYFRVKAEWWDRQWDKPAGFLAWIDLLTEQWSRVLKPNGSLFVFASPQMSARVECRIGERMDVLNRITWDKRDAGWHKGSEKDALRAFFPASESIIFAEQRGSDSHARGGYDAKCEELRGGVFEPLRAYLDSERRRAGIDKAACNAACGFARTPGGMAARHYFGRSQWALPTAEHYASLRALFGPAFLRREYEELRREYEELRRPFRVSAEVPYTDVWTFPTVQHYRGKHPCEKPPDLLRHIIRAATRPGAVVLDSFVGSGATGRVAVEEGRLFVGSEIDPKWVDASRRRIGEAVPVAHIQPRRVPPARTTQAPQQTAQLALFGVAS